MCNDQLIIAYTLLMPSVLGTPQIDNEYFSHNDAHNDAPSVGGGGEFLVWYKASWGWAAEGAVCHTRAPCVIHTVSGWLVIYQVTEHQLKGVGGSPCHRD